MAWEWKTLDQLGSVSRGRSKHRPRDDESLYGGIYPFIQTADVKRSNFYITEYSQTYNERGLAQSKLWRAGTLCFTIAANIADSAILGIDACFPDSIMGFIPYEGVSDVRFVKYCFDVLQQQCKQISQGATQDNLSWEKLSTIKFPAPDYKTQQKIADILSAYDNLIENNQKQIKLLEEAAQRLYKQWFIDLRYPGHETTPIVDGLPEGWRKVTLGSALSKITTGLNPRKNFVLGQGKNFYVTIKNMGENNIYLDDKCDRVNDEALEKINKRSDLKTGDILFSGIGTIGRVYLIDIPTNNWNVSESVFTMRVNECVSKEFLYLMLLSDDVQSYCDLHAHGVAQRGIRMADLKEYKFVLPENKIIDSFTTMVEPIIEKTQILRKSINYAAESRDRLLPKLMNGELEV